MTNKLMIVAIASVMAWTGSDVFAQQSDLRDTPGLDQQAQSQSDMGAAQSAEKRGGKKGGKRGAPQKGRREGPEMLKKMFARMDKDGDGLISIDEAPQQLKEKMPVLDANADGGCDLSELRTAMKNRGNGAGKRGLGMVPGQDQAKRGTRRPGAGELAGRKRGGERSLDRFDKDGDGKISKTEAPERLQQRFEVIDTDGDGFINKTEQQALLQKMSERGKGGRGGEDGANKQGQKPKRPDTGA